MKRKLGKYIVATAFLGFFCLIPEPVFSNPSSIFEEKLECIENPDFVTPSNQEFKYCIKDNWYEISNNCLGFNYGMFNLMQKSAACDKIIGSFKEFVDSYYQIDSVFTNTLFNTQKINTLLDVWSDQIRSSVIDANEKYINKEPSEQVWLSSLNNFKNLINLSLQNN